MQVQDKMASCGLVSSALILCILFMFSSHTATAYFNIHGSGTKDSSFFNPENVNLSIYYEPLSTESATFILNDLTLAYLQNIISIVNLRLIPWGKAHIVRPNYIVVCKVRNT